VWIQYAIKSTFGNPLSRTILILAFLDSFFDNALEFKPVHWVMRIFALSGVFHVVPKNSLDSIAIKSMLAREMERMKSNYFRFNKILGKGSRYSILFINPHFKSWCTQTNLWVFFNVKLRCIPVFSCANTSLY
jgi:hypothetical protein